LTNAKLVEYVQEYDEADWDWVRESTEETTPPVIPTATEKKEFTSHVTETYYAVRRPVSTWTDSQGKVEGIDT